MRKNNIGLWLFVAGVALPFATYLGVHASMAHLAGLGGAPDQGAMMLGFVTLLFAAAIGACLAAAGLVLVFFGCNW